MKTSRITHFFDVIKKETILESEATSSVTHNEPALSNNFKREYVKEEVDIPWNETSHIVAKDQDDVYLSEKDMFNARVVIEKLPDIIVQKYSNSKIKMIENHKNRKKECTSSNVVPKNFTAKTRTNLKNKVRRNDNISNGIDKENVSIPSSIALENVTPQTRHNSRNEFRKNEMDTNVIEKSHDSAPYWKICTKCNKKNEVYRLKRLRKECRKCKTPLIFECKKCHKIVSKTGNLTYHIKLQCVHRRYIYKCFECDFKARSRVGIKNHVRKMHPTMTSQMNCIEIIESNNVQNDLDNARIKKLKCSTCEKKFEVVPKLIKHFQICSGREGTIKNEWQSPVEDLPQSVRRRMLVYCSKCDKDLAYNNTLRGDRLCRKRCPDCKSIMAFKCAECKKGYVSRNGVASHIKNAHSSQQECQCPECDYKSSVLDYLCNHYRNNHITGIHECSKCYKKFDRAGHLYQHSKRCKLKQPYNCDHCSLKTYYKTTMMNHMIQRHSTGNEIDCPKCKVTFKHKLSLKTHQILCGKELDLKCNYCSYKTKYKNAFDKHVLRMHSITKEIECPNCKKILRNEQCFKDHVKLCGSKDYLQCNHCSFKTKCLSTLRYHTLRFHAEGTNINSIIGKSGKHCDVTFKKYRCDLCPYKCNVRIAIYQHIVKNHLIEENLNCPRCNAKFQNNVYLDQHLQYCGLKPHLHCEHCSFKTFKKGQLAMHIKDTHISFDCSKCKKTFKNHTAFRLHRINNCKRILD